MWGEVNLGSVDNADGTSRVRFCQRRDRLFTYYVEVLHDRGWRLLRDGGLFADEAAMQRDARASPDWPRR